MAMGRRVEVAGGRKVATGRRQCGIDLLLELGRAEREGDDRAELRVADEDRRVDGDWEDSGVEVLGLRVGWRGKRRRVGACIPELPRVLRLPGRDAGLRSTSEPHEGVSNLVKLGWGQIVDHPKQGGLVLLEASMKGAE